METENSPSSILKCEGKPGGKLLCLCDDYGYPQVRENWVVFQNLREVQNLNDGDVEMKTPRRQKGSGRSETGE